MKTASFSLVIILLLFGSFLLYDSTQAQSEKNVASHHGGIEVIQRAIEQFQNVKTISSYVRLKCSLFGEEYSGSGFYDEKRLATFLEPAVSPNMFLLVLKFQPDSLVSGSSSSTLKIVANGTDFWKFTNIEGERRQERVELTKVQEILNRTQKVNGKDAKLQPVDVGALATLGGLEATLRQMEKFYDFSSAPVESARLGSESEGLAAWKVSAKLKSAPLAAMVEARGKEKGVLRQTDAYLPTGVCVYFGKDDFFPYRICYFGGVKEDPFADPPTIDLEYLKVSVNGDDIATSRFDYRSENVLIDNLTEEYANRILEQQEEK